MGGGTMLSGAYRYRWMAAFLLFSLALLSRPAAAQVDLTGRWGQKEFEDRPERGPGPEIGDYTAMPINDAARLRGDSWDAQQWEMVEHECQPHPADYGPRGPGEMRIWADVDPFTQGVIAWHTSLRFMLPLRTIYMDGRPHPSENAPHTWQGFSTGEWEADMLKVTTTHLKEGWVRRNGLPRSDRATLIEYFIRHAELFTLVTDVEDPGLSDRAVRSHLELDPQPGELPAPQFLHPERRGSSSRKVTLPITCSARTPG